MTERYIRRAAAKALLAETRERVEAEALGLPELVPFEPRETFERRWRAAVEAMIEREISWAARRLVELAGEGSA